MLNSLASQLHVPIATLVAALLLVGKATMLLLLAWGLTMIMQRTSAMSRHLVWFASLAAILCIPVVVSYSPITVPVLPSIGNAQSAMTTMSSSVKEGADQTATGQRATPSDRANATLNALNPGAERGTADITPAVGASRELIAGWSIGASLLGVWASVAALLSGWLVIGAVNVTRIVRRATTLRGTEWDGPVYETADRLSLDDAPRVLISDDILMPFACGLTRPTIVLPRSAEHWSADQRLAVLLHEMAHVKRRDLIGHTVGRFACALYWFHPLVWTAAKRLRAESERACDDLALLCGARASDYAEQLLDIVSKVKRNTTPSVALAMANRSEFEGRMLAILDPALRRAAPSRWQSATLVGSVVMIAM
ncbi:MAG: M56 family metallopeptidase, partial [Gemmatimonadaceae bacterium]|nr:M56 family metallopeptidase [Gemmatimonadaceae bacterium]